MGIGMDAYEQMGRELFEKSQGCTDIADWYGRCRRTHCGTDR